MKKVLFLAFVAIMSVCFTGCKRQTSFEVDDITTKAVIMGKVTAITGKDKAGNDVKSYVADRTVFIEISNNDLSPNGNANGYTTMTVVTDSEGEYSIEIPTVKNGVSVTVRVGDYTGQYSEEDYYGEKKYTSVIYSALAKNIDIKPDQIKKCELTYERN